MIELSQKDLATDYRHHNWQCVQTGEKILNGRAPPEKLARKEERDPETASWLETEDECYDERTATVREAEIICTAIFGHLSPEKHIRPRGMGASATARAYGNWPVASEEVRFHNSGSKKIV